MFKMLIYPEAVMDYIERLRSYSNKEVNRAAATLLSATTESGEFKSAAALVSDWRTLHEGAVVRFRPIMEAWSAKYPNGVVVTRLKRIPTIIEKLKHRPKGMQLSTMQDIGGLRVIVDTVAEAQELATNLVDHVTPHFVPKLPITDYIARPVASSGYRGIHLIFNYHSQGQDDRNLDGLKIEVQVRTRLQHIWATAVETVGIFRQEALKSGRGNSEWLTFFRLAGELFAQLEHSDSLPPSTELATLRDDLNVYTRLNAYALAQDIPHLPPALASIHYVVLVLDVETSTMQARGFSPDRFTDAVTYQREVEARHIGNPKIDTVMVTTESIEELRKGYPNYFADTADFTNLVYGLRPQALTYGAWRGREP